MALTRTKSNVNTESFHQRFSELSDEIRIRNKREERFLDVRLKYYEREKNIRLNIIRKEQYQLELTRSSLIEQWNKIQQDKQIRKRSIPLYIIEKRKFESATIQLSVPELFKSDWEPSSEQLPAIPINKPITPANVVRPHSAG